jgi:hypothetical protein
MLGEFISNVEHNLFKPLLLFFYMGFAIPLLKVHFEFPHVIYQGITMYLLIAIGWHGGEELAQLSGGELQQALGFMLLGFLTNFFIGMVAFGLLRSFTRMRRVDAATVAGYYGSDSAGTFVTCVGVLTGLQALAVKTMESAWDGGDPLGFIAGQDMLQAYTPAAYMPVMLAVMEVPGCLVALYLVSLYRRRGMDVEGNLPGDPDYKGKVVALAVEPARALAAATVGAPGHDTHGSSGQPSYNNGGNSSPANGYGNGNHGNGATPRRSQGIFDPKVLHEIFFNPGLYLLFGGILIGFVSRLQGTAVTAKQDNVFLNLFDGILCLFLLEMGITACKRLKDLRTAGPGLIALGLLMPNLFATMGILIAHVYSHAIGQPFSIGTYTLFAVLCGAASYIAVPAVQRLAIPEASPTLPLAASLGLTFSYNVTIGIPVYIQLAKMIDGAWPVRAIMS